MGEVILGVEDPLTVSAAIGRRAHSVEDEGIIAIAIQVRGVKVVLGRIDLDVRQVTPIELSKEWLKPMRVLVINGYWLLWIRHFVLFREDQPCRSNQTKRPLGMSGPGIETLDDQLNLITGPL